MKKTKKEEEIIHTYVPSATNKMAKKKSSSELNAEIPYIRHEEKISYFGFKQGNNDRTDGLPWRTFLNCTSYGARLRPLLRSRRMIDRLS